MIAETKPLAEVTREAMQLLYREMGAANAIRFINQFSVGYGNYTEEREALFGDKTLDELVDEIKRSRKGRD